MLVYLGRQPDVLEAVCHGGVGGVEGGGVARGVGQGAHRRGGQLSPDKKEAELSKLRAMVKIVVFVLLGVHCSGNGKHLGDVWSLVGVRGDAVRYH